jgi:CrcB protein
VKYLFIAVGGALGSLLRYAVAGWAQRLFSSSFPWGTLSVNLIGSLAIGLLWGLFEEMAVSQNLRIMIFIGVLGAFTTFSTFSLENFHLLRDGEFMMVLFNVGLSVIGGLVMVVAGFWMSRYLVNLCR